MDIQKNLTIALKGAGLVAATIAVIGCADQGYSVLASTGTSIGVEVSQNPATQMPQGKLGYNRAELAFVPTNRNGGKNSTGSVHNGAADSANVLMELRYGGIFDMGASSGIYQRLAVGTVAVHEPGASVMFAKDAEGELKPGASAAVAQILSAEGLAKQQLSAITKITEGISKADKADETTLKSFFKCAGFDDTTTSKLVTQYKDLSKANFATQFARDFGPLAPEYQTKCIK